MKSKWYWNRDRIRYNGSVWSYGLDFLFTHSFLSCCEKSKQWLEDDASGPCSFVATPCFRWSVIIVAFGWVDWACCPRHTVAWICNRHWEKDGFRLWLKYGCGSGLCWYWCFQRKKHNCCYASILLYHNAKYLLYSPSILLPIVMQTRSTIIIITTLIGYTTFQ